MNLPGLSFKAPPLEYLDREALERLHHGVMAILETVGSVVHSTRALELLQANGADLDASGRVLIPERLVLKCLDTAPGRVMIHDRSRNPAMDLSGTHVYFGTGSDCQYILDPATGRPRDFLFGDLVDAVRLSDSLKHIDFIMSMGLAKDLPQGSAFQRKYLAMVRHSAKPQILITGPDLRSLEDIVTMASLVAGGPDSLARHPLFLLLIDPTSPLVHSGDAMEKLLLMARMRLPVVYAPGIMAGASSPVTVAGAVAQAAAEILTGLVVHQLASPGAPFVFGGGMSPMDMKSSQPTYSAPEAMVAQAGLTQLGRSLYGLPTYGFGGCTASKVCDTQAVNEGATYLMMSAWMGTNLVHDVGYMEFGKTYSLELLTLCDETIGQVRRMMEGIPVDDETLALSAVRRVGPGGTFLTDPHTLKHFRENWQPDLTDRRTRGTWEKQGATTMEQRAARKIRACLESHRPDPLDPDLDRRLEAVVAAAD
jgi:trimethylamine--corrinoid protein Co-methyltransferase